MRDLLDIALNYYGLAEIPGKEHNTLIQKMHEDVVGIQFSDEVPWCSAFMNWICKEAKYEVTRSLAARSWLEVGYPIEKPERGCLAVFWRNSPNSWQGHVALYIREDKSGIWVLGGNQSNRVGINPYPKHRLISYVMLNKVVEPKEVEA